MIDYKTLKHSENGMPTWDAFLGPMLQVASTKDEWVGRELDDAVVKELNLPEDLANLRYSSKYHDLVAINRAGWALSDLKLAGLLTLVRRSIYKISDSGKQALDKYGLNITREFVHSQPAYIEYKKNKQKKNSNTDTISDDQTFEINENQVSNWFDKQKENLSEDLLAKLRKTDPFVFEHMMIKLMTKMGYKGVNGDAFVTLKSNDEGIDGILNQDALGLRRVYVQVKRYAENNTVGRQVISQFHGDLDLQGADSGVFITTSSFSSGAEAAAKRFNIRLIDGEMLTNLMIQYQVGVQIRQSFELFDIDDDFFEE